MDRSGCGINEIDGMLKVDYTCFLLI